MYLYFATFWTRGFQSRWASGAWICAFSLESLRGFAASCGQQGRAMSIGNEKRSKADGYVCVCVCVCVCMWRNRNRQLFEPLFLPFLASPIPFHSFFIHPPSKKPHVPYCFCFCQRAQNLTNPPIFIATTDCCERLKIAPANGGKNTQNEVFFPRDLNDFFGTLYF